MVITPQVREWLDWVLITSHPLRRLDDQENLLGISSGTLFDYRGRRFLLTAQHSVPLGSNDWLLDLGKVSDKGTEIYKPKNFLYVGEYTRSTGEGRVIDFCFSELPVDLNSIYQQRTPWLSGEERYRHVFNSDLTILPSAEQIYAFSGEIQPEKHGTGSYAMTMTVNPGLKYLRTDSEMHVFGLPVTHPGHEHFRGCSGAPIVDMNRQVVALVCGGNEEEGTVYGVSIARYKFALDFYCSAKSNA